jgi:heptosyltransferase II
MSINKILIIHTAFIGDLILLAPLVHETRKAFKDAAIHILGIPLVADVYEHDPAVTRFIAYDKKNKDKGCAGFYRVVQKLKRLKYDLALIPHRSLRSALLAKLARVPQRIGFDQSAGSFLMTHLVEYKHNIHEVERNISLLESYLNRKIEPKLTIITSDAQKQKAGQIIEKLNKPVIAVAPGSVWFTKRWPTQYYAALISALLRANISVILLGGPKDRELVKALPTDRKNILNLVGQLSLLESAEVIGNCSLLISNDSAPLHLASAMNTAVIAIFGPTVPAFGFYPYKVKHKIIQNNLECRPCGMHGSAECPIKTHECMKTLKPKKIFEETMTFLKQHRLYE